MIKRIGAFVFAFTLLFAFAVPASAVLPEGVTQVEYVQGTGAEYIDINYRPTDLTRVEIVFDWYGRGSNPSGTGYLFGSRASSSNALGSYYTGFQVDGTTCCFMYNGQWYYIYDVDTSETLTFVFDGSTASVNGKSVDVNRGNAFNSAFSWYVFGMNNVGSPSGLCAAKVYSMTITEAGTVTADFVPASQNGVFGLFDTIDNKFYGNSNSTGQLLGGQPVSSGEIDSVSETIKEFNSQIEEIENVIYEDLHTYSAQVDPSAAVNFSGNFLSAMSFISDTWVSAYNQLGDMQVIVTFPLFLAIAMLFIGRMNSVIASGAMKSRKNNDKKGGGDVG